jgi:hypothetical protein
MYIQSAVYPVRYSVDDEKVRISFPGSMLSLCSVVEVCAWLGQVVYYLQLDCVFCRVWRGIE